MSEDKQMFTDPDTGQEIESTRLARGAVWVFLGLLSGLVSGLLCGLWGGLGLVLVKGLGFGVLFGLVIGLRFSFLKMERARSDNLRQRFHDTIARAQHRRRQRILRSQEHQDVPDGALSRAQPPGDPQATDAALSIADDPDEPGRLIVSIEEDIQVVVDDRP